MSITVSNQGLTGLTIRCECSRSMRKSQPPHSLSVRESHHTGSVQVPEEVTQVLYLSSIDVFLLTRWWVEASNLFTLAIPFGGDLNF